MEPTNTNTAELKVIHVGNLELSAIGVLDDVKNEFWKRKPINELIMHTNKHNNYISSTYLFMSREDAILFGDLLKNRNINFFYHLESKFDEVATIGMNEKDKEKYFSSKKF